MAGELAKEESWTVEEGRAAEMRRSIDAVNAVRAGRVGNPAMVDAAAQAEAALKMGAGPRSADFARVSGSDIQLYRLVFATNSGFVPSESATTSSVRDVTHGHCTTAVCSGDASARAADYATRMSLALLCP